MIILPVCENISFYIFSADYIKMDSDSDDNVPLAQIKAKRRKINVYSEPDSSSDDYSEEILQPDIVRGIRDLVNLKRKRAAEDKVKRQKRDDRPTEDVRSGTQVPSSDSDEEIFDLLSNDSDSDAVKLIAAKMMFLRHVIDVKFLFVSHI